MAFLFPADRRSGQAGTCGAGLGVRCQRLAEFNNSSMSQMGQERRFATGPPEARCWGYSGRRRQESGRRRANVRSWEMSGG